MKKLTLVVTILTLVVLVAILFTGCAKLKAEKKLLEAGEFVGDTTGEHNDELSLSIKKDKTYVFNNFIYKEGTKVTYEGKWSYVMTYKYKYVPNLSPLERLQYTDRVTLYVFKLEGCSYNGKQGYFVYRPKREKGKIFFTDEKVNKSHFDKFKGEYGRVYDYLVGTEMKKNPNKDE